MDEITITKQLSKQGDNTLLLIPKVLRGELHPRDLVRVQIKVLKHSNQRGRY